MNDEKILNEEDQENIEQVMQGWDEAIPEFVHDLAERVAHEIERYYTAEYHTPQGCEVTIKGSMQIGVEFLQDELRVETTDWTLDTRMAEFRVPSRYRQKPILIRHVLSHTSEGVPQKSTPSETL